MTKKSDLSELTYPIVVFDSYCLLCEASVQFILKQDPKAIFHFAALQGEVGQQLAKHYGISTMNPESWLLVEKNAVWRDSEAALRLCELLGGKIKFFLLFRFIPSGLRNSLYRFIATHRYQLFGKKEVCFLPSPDNESRFYP